MTRRTKWTKMGCGTSETIASIAFIATSERSGKGDGVLRAAFITTSGTSGKGGMIETQ
jgi:hypothetical protein